MSDEQAIQQLKTVVKRLAMTGAFTWGGVHLESRDAWSPSNLWCVSEDAVEEWLADPEWNPNREWVFDIARHLLGVSG